MTTEQIQPIGAEWIEDPLYCGRAKLIVAETCVGRYFPDLEYGESTIRWWVSFEGETVNGFDPSPEEAQNAATAAWNSHQAKANQ